MSLFSRKLNETGKRALSGVVSGAQLVKVCIVLVGIIGCIGNPVDGRYRCTLKHFIRLGNSCYFLSAEIVSWQEAHFRCRDKGAQLAVLASHYEDSTLRSYLERPEFAQLGRWIGGMWAGKWIWAAQGTNIDSQRSFATTAVYSLEDTDQWMCLYMDPLNRYHWNNENCMRQLHYICEAPLARAITTMSNSTDALTNAEDDHVTNTVHE
ncbi:unnamed protein product [Orchesella dallaii]|uniref:C-type lectin domain-containing protein n=1 Tax=Orchesella dallaii TaxID=48710 RepID=A0ABP1QJ53_9HEXA